MTQIGDIQKNKNRARQYLACICYVRYGEELDSGENPVNYAERVWYKNRGRTDTDKYREINVRDFITKAEGSYKHIALLNGVADPMDTLQIEVNYNYIRCKK